MKKFNLLLAFSMAFYAQTQAQISLGFKAGPNFSNFRYRSSKESGSITVQRTSFHAGFTVDVPMNDAVIFQPAILLSGKGAKYDIDVAFDENGVQLKEVIKGKIAPLYIELPLNFLYGFNVGKGKFQFGFGPYVAIGVGGKYNLYSEQSITGSGYNQYNKLEQAGSVTYGNRKENTLKRHDIGLNGLVAYQFYHHIGVQLGYSMGLTSVNPGPTSGQQTKNNVSNLGLFYKW